MKLKAEKVFVITLVLLIEMWRIKCMGLDGGCVFVGTEVHCVGRNLSYIPELPTNVTGLQFTHNFLPNVTKETFENISNPEHILNMNLSYNKITTISEDLFDSFTRITFLDLAGNYIENFYLKQLLEVLCHRNISLVLDNMGKDITSEETFSLMNMCDLESLFLRRNNFITVSRSIIKHFDNIRALYFERNRIQEFQLVSMKRLNVLSISYNDLTHFPNFCLDNDSSLTLVPNIKQLWIRYNKIMELGSQPFKCLSSLTFLDISGNYLTVFPNDMLLNLHSIRNLLIYINNGHMAYVEKYAFRSKTLKYLRFSQNGPATSMFRSINDTFKYVPNLTSLILAFINMDIPTSSLYGLFAPLDKLEKITCYGCKIQHDPSIILDNKDKLMQINLNNNLIDNVNNTLLNSKRFLKILQFEKNKLVHLSSTALPVDFLNRLKVVDFSKNPFSCDCDLKWFIDWLKTANGSKTKYPKSYKCASPHKYVGKLLLDIKFSYLECHPLKMWMWIIIIGLPILLFLFIISTILYRNRWNIKHYIYLFRKRKNYIPIDGANLLYDAFVSYNQRDSGWVINRLIPKLETESNCKLCVHERDFEIGTYINDNIVQRIEESKRMIIILSDAFATSVWCMFELKIALAKHIEDEFEVIVILLRTIKGRNMNKSIKTFLEKSTYLEWTDDVVGEELFWKKLRDAMCKGNENNTD